MDRIHEIAESILNDSIKDSGGFYYGRQVNYSDKELGRAFELLHPYGKVLSIKTDGVNPLYQINDYGRAFIANGGWSEKERIEQKERLRHDENMRSDKRGRIIELAIALISIIGVVLSCLK